MKTLNFLAFIFCFLSLISLTSASTFYFGDFLLPQPQNECFNIPMSCDNCSYMNITVLFPNGTVAIENQKATNLSSKYYYNYTFCDTATLGNYWVILNYDEDGKYLYSDTDFFKVTPNGKEPPEGIVILGFCLIMILIFSTITFYLIRAIGLIIDANFDILDISYAWGLYFGLLGINLLADVYLGSIVVQDWLELFVTLLGFPLIILPVVAFFLSLFRAKKKEKEQKAEW